MSGALWAALWRAIGGAAAVGLAWRHTRARGPELAALRRDLCERRALSGPEPGPNPRLWLHAASMGEVGALGPFARALQARGHEGSLVVTTSTTTGRERALREIGPTTLLAPIDASAPLTRFLDRYQPRLYVGVETELWPNRFDHLAARRVPIVLVSARLSPERLPRYRRAGPLYARCLGRIAFLAPASEADRERFSLLGAPRARLGPIGNLKWDAAPLSPTDEQSQALRASLGLADQPWIVLGSVHPGEAAPLLDAIRREPRGDRPHVLVAPRHPARFDDVAGEVERAGHAVWRLSKGVPREGDRVVLLDRLGVLAMTYGFARAAFLGGTLVAVGGHSPLEAAACGCPLVAGPHVMHQRDLVEPLAARGAIFLARDAREAGSQLVTLAHDDQARAQAGDAARALVDEERGVALRLVDALEAWLP